MSDKKTTLRRALDFRNYKPMQNEVLAARKRIAELENLLAEAKTIIIEKNAKIMELKQNKGIAELEKALGNALQTLHITNNHGKAYKGCEVCKKFGSALLKGAS